MKTTIRPILPALPLWPAASLCKPVRRNKVRTGDPLPAGVCLYDYAMRETQRIRSQETLIFSILLLCAGSAIWFGCLAFA